MVSKKEPPSRDRHRRPPLGQNFLVDRAVEQRILTALSLKPDDIVLEIGAGRGNMTALIAGRVAKVIAIEIDSDLVSLLHSKFGGCSNVEIREQDILKVEIDTVTRDAGREKIKVYGNLPYYITSPCLMHLFQYHASIDEIVVMVQEEVAQRMVAKPGSSKFGLLSLTCQYYCEPALLFSVGPHSFSPPPKVRSAIVRMKLQPQRDALGISIDEEPHYWNIVRRAFSQKRKTLFNNLKSITDPDRLHSALNRADIDPKARAETLSLQQFAALFQGLKI
jgi:16S rRNA (adenine1518-N6/adenine1519-N6)-dimethyltransferase